MARGKQGGKAPDSGTNDRGGDREVEDAGAPDASTIANIEQRMNEAAAALDFEAAKRLRDRIGLMRGGATSDEAAAADTSGLTRQQPGRMGLGTSQQRITPPPGWKAPPKPDLMTNLSGRGRRGGSDSTDKQS